MIIIVKKSMIDVEAENINCYDCNQTFANESNFNIRNWYAVKQPTQPNQIINIVQSSTNLGRLKFVLFKHWNGSQFLGYNIYG